MDIQDIKQILSCGIQAPSGENAQPWLLKIEKESVSLFNNPESDQSLYNYKQSGSFVAHGAFIENVVIAAEAVGYRVDIDYFPDRSTPNFVASLKFKSAPRRENSLEPSISLRSTNRKSYDASPLTKDERDALTGDPSFAKYPVRLVAIESREEIARLANVASLNEKMLADNKSVHDFFFNHVRWTEEENQKHPKGFYIDTLELKPPQVAVFKMLRSWPVASVLGKIGISKLIKKDNERIYNTASAIIGIVVKDNTPLNLVIAGRCLERVWLTATKLGLSIQPMAGALFLAEGAREGNRDSFSTGQRAALEDLRSTIYGVLGAHPLQEYVTIMVRVGRGGEPSARSARFPLDQFLI